MNTQQDGALLPNNQPRILEESEHKGDLLIWDIWKKGMEIIHDIHVVDTDAISYLERSP